MTAGLTLAAVTASLVGLAYLTVTDPKRRRVFGLPPRSRRLAPAAGALVFLPGAALLAAGLAAAFVIWLGATTVLGWRVAARAPAGEGSAAR